MNNDSEPDPTAVTLANGAGHRRIQQMIERGQKDVTP